jgi:DNA replication and repair protein RecF
MHRHLSRLRLSHFRNYPTAALDLDERHVVLVGPNGAGKTNLLEAVSLLSPGRGLRRAPFETLVENGAAGPWAVAATVETPDGPVDIGTGLADNGSGRRVRINGANAPSIESMADYVRIAWLTPDMDALFRGPAADRRRFFDRLVMTLVPGHGTSVASFDTAMRQRNRLLETAGDPAWLDAVEAQMAEHAAALYFARLDALSHLQVLASQSVDESAFPASRLALTAMGDGTGDPVSSTALEMALTDHWRRSRARDAAAGRATLGPHRIDFEVTHAQKSMPAALCSTGEQKALLIGLVLAHARLVKRMTGLTPILLLDEIAAHLDPDRRKALFAALDALKTQCFMTGTDLSLFEAIGPARRFFVKAGTIAPIG